MVYIIYKLKIKLYVNCVVLIRGQIYWLRGEESIALNLEK